MTIKVGDIYPILFANEPSWMKVTRITFNSDGDVDIHIKWNTGRKRPLGWWYILDTETYFTPSQIKRRIEKGWGRYQGGMDITELTID